jgi:putative salt-induced outer membrane protein YdiY
MAVLAVLAPLIASPLFAKRKDDVVVLKNGDRVTGEIKKIEHGTLFFKPDYALDNMEIDWTRVEQLESLDRFNVVLTDGTVHSGLIRKAAGGDDFTISVGQTVVRALRAQVIRVMPTEESIWKQITGSVDYGFTFDSDNSQTQSSLGASASYFGEENSFAANLSSSLTRQTSGSNTSRNSFSMAYSKRLSRNWSAIALGSFLTSSQQKLDRRTSLGGGVGRALIRTSNTRSLVSGGLVVSREKYSPEAGPEPVSTETEAWLGLDYSHFRFKLFDLNSRLIVFPSLTTQGRVRLISESNVRWEFISNVYWNLRIYENYDSHPPITAPKNDFGVTTSLGWSF